MADAHLQENLPRRRWAYGRVHENGSTGTLDLPVRNRGATGNVRERFFEETVLDGRKQAESAFRSMPSPGSVDQGRRFRRPY